jgi:hypothetical protein
MTHYIILISGYARSGKDTLANAIANQLTRQKRHPHIIKFSDSLKGTVQGALDVLNVGDKFDAFTENDEAKKSIRPLLVAMGEFCRSLNPDVFVNYTIEEIKTTLSGTEFPQFIIIPDCRYLNEDKCIRAYSKQHGDIEVIRIHIQRANMGAANPEEQRSIEALNNSSLHYRIALFDDGDLESIQTYAINLLSDKPWGLNHMNQLQGISNNIGWEDIFTPSPWMLKDNKDKPKPVDIGKELDEIREGMDKVNALLADMLKRIARIDKDL